MGSAPYLGGGFGHFYAYAPTKIEYAIDRFAMEVKRQLDVLDRRLADNEYLAGDEYTIADIAVWPWYGGLAKGLLYGAGEFLSVQEYKNVQRWTDAIAKRPAVRRGRMVNRLSGEPSSQLHERHDASDFDTKTQDKIGDKIGEKSPSRPRCERSERANDPMVRALIQKVLRESGALKQSILSCCHFLIFSGCGLAVSAVLTREVRWRAEAFRSSKHELPRAWGCPCRHPMRSRAMVYFASGDGATQLVGYVFAPLNSGPHPAVVMLHGRAGALFCQSMKIARGSPGDVTSPCNASSLSGRPWRGEILGRLVSRFVARQRFGVSQQSRRFRPVQPWRSGAGVTSTSAACVRSMRKARSAICDRAARRAGSFFCRVGRTAPARC